jgi:uncharacterized membrane protein YdjX (TVP38/TMEM64 family)
MKKRKIGLITLVVLAITILLCWYRQPLIDFLRVITDQAALSDYLSQFGPIGPVVLFVLLISQVFIAVIPGHALMVSAGYIYGLVGFVVVVSSTVIGSQIAFLLSRRYGRDLIFKLARPDIIKHWEKIAQNQGVLFFFFGFVLPIFPSDLMCYVAGLATISPKRFFIANLLGRTCCATFITFIGVFGLTPPIWFWILAIICLSAFFGGWKFYQKRSCLQVS